MQVATLPILSWLTAGEKIVAAVTAAIIAVSALATLFLIGLRSQKWQRNSVMWSIYSEFWNDATLARARVMLDYDVEYESLSKIFRRMRLKDNPDCAHHIAKDEIPEIEAIDKLCAFYVRAISLRDSALANKDIWLWESMFKNYWERRFKERIELAEYISKYWPGLQKQLQDLEKKPDRSQRRSKPLSSRN